MTPAATLRRFLPRPRVEYCGLCGAPLAPGHAHLLDIETRRLTCACDPCSVLFSRRDSGKYRPVGREVRYLSDFAISDAEWESLRIPIGLAFFFYSTAADRLMAVYPGPAGPTESLLPVDLPIPLEPDTQALLVNRIGSARDHYLVPIDQCYRLTGVIRLHWRGLSGGEEVWREIERFFAQLKEAAVA